MLSYIVVNIIKHYILFIMTYFIYIVSIIFVKKKKTKIVFENKLSNKFLHFN